MKFYGKIKGEFYIEADTIDEAYEIFGDVEEYMNDNGFSLSIVERNEEYDFDDHEWNEADNINDERKLGVGRFADE